MNEIQNNWKTWSVVANRYPNTDGSDWGWIEGTSPEVFWSNNRAFNREKAEVMVRDHNEALEEGK